MAKLSTHQSSKFVKLLYIGDSGTGKTGSLTSLIEAGYELRILDTDNGLDILRQMIRHKCPDRLDAVDFETVRDTYVEGPIYQNGVVTGKGPTVTKPRAYLKGLDLMTTWSDGSKPCEWGENTIFVLDSLSTYARAAFEWARNMNPAAKDGRQWYGTAQSSMENVIAMLTSEAFQTNVLIISHVRYQQEGENGPIKGSPMVIGASLSNAIAKYFNTLILAETVGSGAGAKRRIKTIPNGVVDLKTAAPFKLNQDLPLESGMATIFKELKDA